MPRPKKKTTFFKRLFFYYVLLTFLNDCSSFPHKEAGVRISQAVLASTSSPDKGHKVNGAPHFPVTLRSDYRGLKRPFCAPSCPALAPGLGDSTETLEAPIF